jgi:predicted nucleic acid-binding protein
VATLFLDTSALVKLYVDETGTDSMLALAHPGAGNKLAILSITRVEFRAAIRRRAKLGDLDEAAANGALGRFAQHLSTLYFVQPLNETVLDAACGVIDRHVLRAYDSMQLAGCLTLRTTMGDDLELRFVSADQALLYAANADGLAVIDPVHTP